MRGKLLNYDLTKATGVITVGDERYSFAGVNFNGDIKKLRPGIELDFVADSSSAIEIYMSVPSGAASSSGEKNKIAAGLLAIFLGGLGIHKFYLGNSTQGIIMLLCSIFGFILFFIPTIIISIIAFIEGIIYLTKSDDDFAEIYVEGKRGWF
jgi:TM2 domain-containing membrane protein YozV